MDNFSQGTKEWFNLRRGRFTSSLIENLCKPKGLGDTGETYIMSKLSEIVVDPDLEVESFSTMETRWGNEYEPLAADVYAREKNKIVEEIGFEMHPDFKFWGGSADRKTYDNGTGNDFGICEIKCPFLSGNHLQHRRIKDNEYFKKYFAKYFWQCVSNCIIYGVEYCDFISFDPRMSKQYGLFVYRLIPSKEDKQFLYDRINLARTEMIAIAHELSIEL